MRDLRPGTFLVPYGTISALEFTLLDDVDKVVVDDWRESRSGNPRFGALRRQLNAAGSPRTRSMPNSATSSPA